MKTLNQIFLDAQDELLKADVLLVSGQSIRRCSHCQHFEKRGKRSGVCYLNGIIVTRKDGTNSVRLPVVLFSDVCVDFKERETI